MNRPFQRWDEKKKRFVNRDSRAAARRRRTRDQDAAGQKDLFREPRP